MKLPPKKKSRTSSTDRIQLNDDPSEAGAQPQFQMGRPSGAPPSNTAPYNCINNNSIKILRGGVDSLYLSYSGNLAQNWDEKLSSLKVLAQSRSELESARAQIFLGEHAFEVMGRGAGRFSYVLADAWYRIQVSSARSEALPLAYSQISSELLTLAGVTEAEKRLRFVVNTLGLIKTPARVSRVDLCLDFITSTDLESIHKDAWVTRSHGLHKHYDKGKFSSWNFGIGSDMSARLYNKTLELKKSKKEFLFPLWKKAGWKQKQTVWRLEFQYRRPVLKQLNVLTIDDLLKNQDGLWQYAIEKWLRLTIPNTKDKTQTRWPTHPLWECLTTANITIDKPTLSLSRVSKQRIPSDEILFVNGLWGMTSFMAREGIHDLYEGVQAYFEKAIDYHHFYRQSRTGLSFSEQLHHKISAKAKQYNVIREESKISEAERQASADKYLKKKNGN